MEIVHNLNHFAQILEVYTTMLKGDNTLTHNWTFHNKPNKASAYLEMQLKLN